MTMYVAIETSRKVTCLLFSMQMSKYTLRISGRLFHSYPAPATHSLTIFAISRIHECNVFSQLKSPLTMAIPLYNGLRYAFFGSEVINSCWL